MTCRELADMYGMSKLEINRIVKRLGISMQRGRRGSDFSDADLTRIYKEMEVIKSLQGKNIKITLKGTPDKRIYKEKPMDDDLEDIIEEEELEEEEELDEEDEDDDDEFDDEEDEDTDVEDFDEDELDDLDDDLDEEDDDFDEEDDE